MPAPTLSKQTDFVLYYPPTTPTTTITLTAPEFSNTDSLVQTRILREPRGQDKDLAKVDTIWPKNRIFRFEFNSLTQAERDSVLDFFEESLGKQIRIRDHENRQWDGFIIDPNERSIDDGVCKYKVSFTFKGTLV